MHCSRYHRNEHIRQSRKRQQRVKHLKVLMITASYNNGAWLQTKHWHATAKAHGDRAVKQGWMKWSHLVSHWINHVSCNEALPINHTIEQVAFEILMSGYWCGALSSLPSHCGQKKCQLYCQVLSKISLLWMFICDSRLQLVCLERLHRNRFKGFTISTPQCQQG